MNTGIHEVVPTYPVGQKKRVGDFRITAGGFPKLRGWGTTPLRSPTWWGSNLDGGRKAESREPVSYAIPVRERGFHKVKAEELQ